MVRQRKGVGRWYVVVSSYDLDKMILHICPDGFKKDLLAWCCAVPCRHIQIQILAQRREVSLMTFE
jgi:hypothetical protein